MRKRGERKEMRERGREEEDGCDNKNNNTGNDYEDKYILDI